MADLLTKALPEADDALYHLALAVEGDPELSEMASEWDSTAGDGIESQ